MKKLSVVFLTIVLFLSMVTVSKAASASGPGITLSTVTANSGDTIDVSVVLSDNPGIAILRLQVSYNTEVLTLKSVTDGGLFSDNVHSDDFAASPYTLSWYNLNGGVANCTGNGVLATLHFQISPFAETGSYDLSLSYGTNDALNEQSKPVSIESTGGMVTLLPHWDEQHKTFQMKLPENMTVLAAGYQGGRMQFCRILREASDSEEASMVSFVPPDTTADTIKLFFMNETYSPVHEALCISQMK